MLSFQEVKEVKEKGAENVVHRFHAELGHLLFFCIGNTL